MDPGRPQVDTVSKIYKLDPRVIEANQGGLRNKQNLTESAVANELLHKAIIVISS